MEKDTTSNNSAVEWRSLAPLGLNYEVSNTGKVRKPPTDRAPEGHILRQHKGTKGSPTVRLVFLAHGLQKRESHRSVPMLVAAAFPELVPNPHDLPRVGFRNGDESNCAASNLYWIDYPRAESGYQPRVDRVTPTYQSPTKRLSVRDARILAGQQDYWNSMSPEVRAEELKHNTPMQGVVIDGVTY